MFPAGAVTVVAAFSLISSAHAHECRIADLGVRASALAAVDAGIKSLPASDTEKKLAALDRIVTGQELDQALACLSNALEAQRGALPAEVKAYPAWQTDGRIHYFPGNDYSYGRIFTNPLAESYFKNTGITKTGAAIVKEAFRFDEEGRATIHEIALVLRGEASSSSGTAWRWIKVDSAGIRSENPHECLVCHALVKENDHLFGYRLVATKKK